MRLIFAVAFGLALTACGGGGGTGTLMLSWSFADLRDCPDEGVSVVAVAFGATSMTSALCQNGLAPAAISVDNVPDGASDFTLVANSSQGTELDRGTLHLDALVPAATVTLYATGSR